MYRFSIIKINFFKIHTPFTSIYLFGFVVLKRNPFFLCRFDKMEQAGINLRVKLGLYLKAEISKTDANNRKLIKYDNFNIIYANLLTYQRIGCVIFDLDF